jgi:hypothetical protein
MRRLVLFAAAAAGLAAFACGSGGSTVVLLPPGPPDAGGGIRLPDGGAPDAGATPDGGPGAPDGGSAAAPVPPPLGWCSAGGFCHANPLPAGHDVRAMWGSADDDVWAVGPAGLLLHFDGAAWDLVDLGTSEALVDVHGTGRSDVTVLAEGGDLHRFDGTRWTRLQDLSAVTDRLRDFAEATGSRWATCGSADLLRWDGSRWLRDATSPTGSFQAVWGSAADDVWALGSGAWHRDASGWHAVTVPAFTGDTLYSVAGAARDDVFATGNAALYHLDGASWSLASAVTAAALQPVGGGRTWAIRRQQAGTLAAWPALWDGAAWTNEGPASARPLEAIWAGARDGWALGWPGMVQRWDGAAWTDLSGGFLGAGETAEAVGVVSPTDVWVAAANMSARHWDGAAWRTVALPETSGLFSVFALARDRVYFPTYYGVYAWDGARVGIVGGDANVVALDVWADGASNVWAAGSAGRVWRYDGARWTSFTVSPLPSGTGFRGIAGTSASDVWAAGSWLDLFARPDGTGTLAHWDGSAWAVHPVSGTVPLLLGVWGSAPADYWAVGDAGTILHWDGLEWRRVESGTTARLRRVWGTSATDVWAVGDLGTVLHYDGASWRRVPSGTRSTLTGVGGAGGAVVAVGGTTVIYRR